MVNKKVEDKGVSGFLIALIGGLVISGLIYLIKQEPIVYTKGTCVKVDNESINRTLKFDQCFLNGNIISMFEFRKTLTYKIRFSCQDNSYVDRMIRDRLLIPLDDKECK